MFLSTLCKVQKIIITCKANPQVPDQADQKKIKSIPFSIICLVNERKPFKLIICRLGIGNSVAGKSVILLLKSDMALRPLWGLTPLHVIEAADGKLKIEGMQLHLIPV